MTVEIRGSSIYATGVLTDDYIKFKTLLARSGIERVVFINSPGGDLWSAMRIGHLIREQGLSTVAAGYCVSACAIMFMGGKERAFSDAFKPEMTFVGIHGPHNKDTKVVNTTQGVQIYHFLKDGIGERFNSKVFKMALYDMDEADAMLRVFDSPRQPKRVPFHCRTAKASRETCTVLDKDDALSLGIVTTDVYAAIDLPPGFPTPDVRYRTLGPPSIAGYELLRPIDSPWDFLRDLSVKQCTNTRCRESIAAFPGYKAHRALAIELGSGIGGNGWSVGYASETEAFLRAVYYCNQYKNEAVHLCETKLVDNYDLGDFYASAATSHAEALAQLTVPSREFFGEEEAGVTEPGDVASSVLRTEQLESTPPRNLPRVHTFGTQELAMALKGEDRPLLVDVANIDAVLPGAQSLLNGGIAHADFFADTAFESRFIGLLKLLSSDKHTPIIFYSKGLDWYGANAALRAVNYGYRQVGWYRGGLASWRAADLPVARPAIRAVVE